ncbi:GPI anchored cell wall protein [Amylocarpus encephaloides]|uniref:GPI anchored cell wall protein n=1 Tax=Amylocarpus encephaloides TaxID=45428 RepID=A0A9P8C0J3_9HELO|nr:GPI anchored cell wall protein [Amylocarpus encephaloides]
MKSAFAATAFGLGASAATLPRDMCMFTLTTSGGQSGVLGQLGDGQNRVGGNLPTGSYSINNGQITDAMDRGCILTAPTTQLQCDVGATPTGSFSIGSNGELSHSGSSTFYACPASETEYNIYATPVDGQTKCVEVHLTASGCYVTQPPPPPATTMATKTMTSQPNSPSSTAGGSSLNTNSCPGNLNGPYQFPHLIVPVSKSTPNTAYGTQYNGQISSDISTIFNFDIPASYTGTCSLVFLFPKQDQLETSSFTCSGDGKFDFKQLNHVASQSTTYANQGDSMADYGRFTAMPGSSTVVATFPCPAGQAVSYEMSAVSGTSLEYFQDYNPSPIGAYITTC